MTQSIIDVEWKEGGWTQQPPTAVINLDLNGQEFIMDLITYNENIEAGRTKFAVIDGRLKMVSELEYRLLQNLENKIDEWKKGM